MRGFFSNDTITAGRGNDTVRGGDGSDTYVFNAGDGQDTIHESVAEISYADSDVLQFGSGILPANVTLSRSADNLDLILSIGATDKVTIKGQFAPFSNKGSLTDVETVKFADGTVWTEAFMRQKLVDAQKTAAADIVTGFYASERIDGGTGNDTLRGGEGGDTYVFASGYGTDTIEETASVDRNQPDTVEFTGLTRAQVTFAKVGNDLKITRVGSTTDVLTVKSHFDPLNVHARVEAFKFTDQTLSYQDVNILIFGSASDGLTVTINGTASAETLTGTTGDDVIAGRGGADTINSTHGNDTFVYAAGDGSDTINENYNLTATDVLRFADLKSADAIFERRIKTNTGGVQSFDTDLYIAIPATGHTLRLVGQLSSPTTNLGVELIRFGDGEIWDRAKIWSQANVGGTAGADTIRITGAVDAGYSITYDLGAGNDTIEDLSANTVASGGNDSYVWGAGCGNDAVTDRGNATDQDRVTLKGIYKPADLTFTRSGLDLILTVAATGETLRLVNQFQGNQSAAAATGVEQIAFADDPADSNPGVVLNRLDLLIRAPLIATAGTGGDDGLDGRAGLADILQGGDGNDAYLFGRGSGADQIAEAGGAWTNGDRVVFKHGVNPEDIRLSRVGSDLVLQILGTSDTLTVKGHYDSNFAPWYEIENFAFDNGTVWTKADVNALIIQSLSTAGNDTIAGFAGADVISGGAGADTITGADGNDTLDGGTGNDTIDGGFGDDVILFGRGSGVDSVKGGPESDTLLFGAGIGTGDVTLIRSGDDLEFRINGTTDRLLLPGQYSSNTGAFSLIETYRFADGTVWTSDAVQVASIKQSQTAGNDSVFGFDGRADELDGGKGNDQLQAGSGDDTYVFRPGDGADTIIDGGGTDRILFGFGIAPGDIQLVRTASDLELRIAGTADRITLPSMYSYSQELFRLIETIEFADGTAWSANDVKLRLLSLAATSGNDTIAGFQGDDILDGLAGDDTLRGDNGNDTYVFGRGYGSDTVDDGPSIAVDTVRFKTGIAPADIQLQRSGDNLIVRLAGSSDQLTLVSQVSSTYATMNRIERFVFSDGTVWTDAQMAAKLLTGTSGADTILGYGSNDTILGLGGNDTISGGWGNDRIDGGSGWDTMAGDTGNDTFAFISVADVGLTDGQTDVINGFVAGTDRIDLSAIDANAGAAGDQAFTFIGTGAMTATPGQLRYVQFDNTGTANDYTQVRGDINGDLAADFSIRLNGLVTPTAADFIL